VRKIRATFAVLSVKPFSFHRHPPPCRQQTKNVLEALASRQLTLALPFQYQFTAGAIAGVSEILLMYPLDVIKTRFQLQVAGSGEQYSGMLDCLRKIVKNEGYS